MNIMPEWYMEMYEHMRSMRMREAMEMQEKMTRRMYEFWHRGDDVFVMMKMEWNKMNGSMKFGQMRKPVYNLNKRMH